MVELADEIEDFFEVFSSSIVKCFRKARFFGPI